MDTGMEYLTTRQKKAIELYNDLKKDFENDSIGTCVDILLQMLAENIIARRDSAQLTDLEKISKLVMALSTLRRDTNLVIPDNTEEAIEYILKLRASDKLDSQKFMDLNYGIEQRISYNDLKEIREFLKSSEELKDKDVA